MSRATSPSMFRPGRWNRGLPAVVEWAVKARPGSSHRETDMQRTTMGGASEAATGETPGLIASDKVEGTRVYNRAGERLGSIYNLMIDKRTGQVQYAVMSF